MKNEILDDIFDSKLRNQLKPDEKVIWEGTPHFKFDWNFKSGSWNQNLFLYLIILSGFFIILFQIIAIVITFPTPLIIITFLLFLSIPAFLLYKNNRRKKTKYLLSDQRILFQLWNYRGLEYRFIHFDEMEAFFVVREKKDFGNISFRINKSKNKQSQKAPSLIQLENIKEVSEYIKKGIQGEL
ncbi:MAG: hypothetical protein AB8F94_18175 [Saprospiraceae bacterium]